MSLLTCQQCRIGRYQTTTAAYMEPLGRKQVLVIPNVPAQVCDVCGQTQYDSEFMSQLEHLLEEWTGGLHPKKKGKRPNLADKPGNWQPTERSI